ncbi:MAG: T9SS type A sorting domain-containing protein [Deferribacteres bacterium]|nr:T9SS type A sorting domain-containing protein [Deferribacteres bacterium]
MKNTKSIFTLFIILIGISKPALAQISLDGDSTDWNAYPAIIEAPDNLQSVFPIEVGAAVTDIVDLKTIKATVISNVLFVYLEFWSGPAWPNNAYHNEHDGIIYYESRGFYNLLLDIDNNANTGWRSDWYEAHLSPVGYLISQNYPYSVIGAEIFLEWYARTSDDWKVANEGADPVRNLEYWAFDYEEYDGVTDFGSDYEIFNMRVLFPDSARMMQWQGFLNINSSDNSLLVADTTSLYWAGHGWGHNFLEFAVELTPLQKYYMHKDGRTILKPGDTIGICGMVETPIDDWGIDMTTGGSIVIGQSVGVAENTSTAEIERFVLSQNYPNPFNPTTTISYQLPQKSHVELTIYNISGQRIETLVTGQQAVGSYEYKWRANGLPSGVYFFRLTAGREFVQKKLILLK